ncbi:hypothetical protein Pfo_000536 [Paulownia fortunei]|nr:hypothetical protein Pfo_000536 [Paulownia fortunei]
MVGNENRSGVTEDRMREPVKTQSKNKHDQIEHNIEILEGHILKQLDSLKENVQACLDADTFHDDRLTRLETNVIDALQAMQISIEILREDLAGCKKAATTERASIGVVSPRVDYPKPNGFDSRRDAKEVENFLWQMQHYFEGLNLTDEVSREDFKKELKRYFYPKNIIYEARKKLQELKQQGTIREYIKDFTTIMLQIPNLLEEDLLFHFSVNEAIAFVESLTEYQPHTDTSKKKEKWNPTKGRGQKWDNQDQQKIYPPKEGDRNPSRKEYKEKKCAFVPQEGCFVCKEPHATSNYPKLGSLSAMVERNEATTTMDEGTSNIGSIRLLNTLNAKPLLATSSKGLMYVETYISRKPTKALVETGATHNFISEEEANRLGLRWSRGEGWLKTVKTKAQPLNGIVKNVELCLGPWKGQVDFSVAPMDDFKVVLGMDFLRKETAIPMPSFNFVCILEKRAPCMIPTIDPTEGHSQGTKTESRHLSAMQITKGVKWGESTYLATLKEKVPVVTKEEDLPPIIQNVLEKNKDVMPDELPKKLPPRREVDHKIKLEPSTKPSAMAPYKLLDKGWIRPSKAPYITLVLFQKKHNGSLRICVDYRALNKDEPKMACITRDGSFEWLVMPFGLTNAPPYLDQFMVVYLDDIVIYNNSLEEHANHLRTVFQVLRENELFEEVLFLGHIIGHGQLQMDRAKIPAIVEWEAPTKVIELWSFLGLINYYCRFIQGYSTCAAPLMDLLKKGKTWEWFKKCQHAFDDLKAAVSSEPILALLNFDKPFKLHMDASDFAIGGVLMQKGHTIAFKSRKLNDTKRRYTVQEKEMTAIIHYLRVWRHYLLGSHFIIKINNVATSYFQTQKKLSPKQARWQDFLAEFDYTLEYKPKLVTVSQAKGEITDLIKQGLEQDPLAKELKKLAVEGKIK